MSLPYYIILKLLYEVYVVLALQKKFVFPKCMVWWGNFFRLLENNIIKQKNSVKLIHLSSIFSRVLKLLPLHRHNSNNNSSSLLRP